MGVSTKYPSSQIIFPWLTHEEAAVYPFILYPNWRFIQRQVLSADASEAEQAHARASEIVPTPAHYFTYQVLQFLASIKSATRVAVDLQEYGGEAVVTRVLELTSVYWCGGVGTSIPRLDCRDEEGLHQHWGPLLIGIAPVQPDTPFSTHRFSTLTKDCTKMPGRDDSALIQILNSHGIARG